MLKEVSKMVCSIVGSSHRAGRCSSCLVQVSRSVRHTQRCALRTYIGTGNKSGSLFKGFERNFWTNYTVQSRGIAFRPAPFGTCPLDGCRSSLAVSALHYDSSHIHPRRFGSGSWENDDGETLNGHADWRTNAAASAAYPAQEKIPERPLPLPAIGANLLILGAKLITWHLSGSSAMLAEAVHSFVDTVNQALLRVGITSSKRAATALHPYGYMKEKFVWSLVSAVGIFCLGAGVTFANAFTHFMHPPEALDNLNLGFVGGLLVRNAEAGVSQKGSGDLARKSPLRSLTTKNVGLYAVLLLSGLVEGFSLVVATRSVFAGAHAAGLSFREYVVRGMDPTSVAVMLEDAAAVAGLIFAGVATLLVQLTGNPVYDALGSFAVGMLLAGTAIFLILQNRSLLIGRSMNRADLQRVIYLLERDTVVKAVHDAKSEEIGPGIFRFKAEIEFNGDVMVDRHMERLGGRDRLYVQMVSALNTDRPKENLDLALRAHGRDMIVAVGAEVDRLEAIIRQAMPSIRHIDLETDRGGKHGL